MTNKFLSRLRDKKNVRLRTNFVMVIGLIGIFLIFISGYIGKSDNKKTSPVTFQTTDEDAYKEQVCNELQSILSRIKGVGNVDVMVSVKGTTEYVYAEQINSSNQTEEGSSASKYQSEIVIINSEGDRQALIKKVIKPEISGVLIVCDGGDDILLAEKVINAVSAALNISKGKICVAKNAS